MTLYLEDLQIVELAIVRVKEHLTGFYVEDAKVEVREHLSRLGDINGNGIIDDYDLDLFKKAFDEYYRTGVVDPDCDFNGDGEIDQNDLWIIMGNFGKRQCDVEPVDTVLTSKAGLANFGELPPEKYFVTVSKEGYKTTSATIEFPATLDVNVWPMTTIYASVGAVALAGIVILAGTKYAGWW